MSDITALTDTLVNPLTSLNVNYIDDKLTSAGGGDAHFFEESIHPSTIKTYLSSYNTGASVSVTATVSLLKGMKWLLAMMSKGRDVSSFFSDVVKLVSCPNMEIKKISYMYLVEYADYSPQCRELALLSINSFQRGLADAEQLIRALALRVLTCIRVPDILQIQILAVRKCIQDDSPYVRKCAANAISKLYHHLLAHTSFSDVDDQVEVMMQLLENLLNTETSTMVLSSAMTTFIEICPTKLELLHKSYRKLCHLLTDMDEWGQIVTIDVLSRYCRANFVYPGHGEAEKIDAQRRRLRQQPGIKNDQYLFLKKAEHMDNHEKEQSHKTITPVNSHKTTRRRVIQKGFYSDDEDDEFSEESDNESTAYENIGNLKQGQELLEKDIKLDDDHDLILKSALPLLKSRNSGVVLAVCSLHYYCGFSSIEVRSSFGKALVRIHRDNREIQHVVLNAIRFLSAQCPSAFSPYLNDFFIKAMDPSFARLMKLEILTSLAIEPSTIAAVLREFRSYIRHDDKAFVRATIRAIGNIALSRMNKGCEGNRDDLSGASKAVLDCLNGLMTLSYLSRDNTVVGECISTMCHLSQMSHFSLIQESSKVSDSNEIRIRAMHRIILLVIHNLAPDEFNLDNSPEASNSDTCKKQLLLPPNDLASALWIIGEWGISGLSSLVPPNLNLKCDPDDVRKEIIRLAARSFSTLDQCVRLQCIHLASKLYVAEAERKSSSKLVSDQTKILCEYILGLGRLDIDTDVRDRARFESSLLDMSIGLKGITRSSGLEVGDLINENESRNESQLVSNVNNCRLSIDTLKAMLIKGKPMPNSWPFYNKEEDIARFGSLSSVVGHHAGKTYFPLPSWSEISTASTLRDPVISSIESKRNDHIRSHEQHVPFYENDNSSSSSSDSDSENSDSESENDSDSESDSKNDSDSENGSESSSNSSSDSMYDDSTVSGSKDNNSTASDGESESDDSSVSSSSTNSSAVNNNHHDIPTEGNLIAMPSSTVIPKQENFPNNQNTSSFASELKGLTMAPLPKMECPDQQPDQERDASIWYQLLRPELSGGLSVTYRYVRGASKEQELRTFGFERNSPALCLQFKFVNKRGDNVVHRHVRMLQRGGLGIRRIVLPEEISALSKNQGALAIVGIDFGEALTTSGTCSVRFDIKTGAETYPAEVKPPLNEVLQASTISVTEFNDNISHLTGFQKASFLLVGGASQGLQLLSGKVLKNVSVTIVKSSKDERWFAGKIPQTTSEVYVVLDTTKVTLYCENAIVLNSLLSTLKAAVI